MYKCTNSQLPATFSNYLKLITDVHPHNATSTTIRHIALPKASSISGAKLLIQWNRNLVKNAIETKNKSCLTPTAEDNRNVVLGHQKDFWYSFHWSAITKCTEWIFQTMLLRKWSNFEVSLLCLTPFGFWCVHYDSCHHTFV